MMDDTAMDNTATPEVLSRPPAKSVQDHIDELPLWADGTRLRLAPMTGMLWLIWLLAAAGKFFEGFVGLCHGDSDLRPRWWFGSH